MLGKLLKGVARVIVFAVKVVVFPITYTWRRLKKRDSKQRPKGDFPGVYIVSNSPNTLKIGRSKHVMRRLKSYRGYQADGRDIQRLLLIRCQKHKELEKLLHQYAADLNLVRMGRTEVFRCNNKAGFIKNVIDYVATVNRRGLKASILNQ